MKCLIAFTTTALCAEAVTLNALSTQLPENLATGAYAVTAGKGNITATTTLSVTALPPIQLTAPAKTALSGGIASWTADLRLPVR